MAMVCTSRIWDVSLSAVVIRSTVLVFIRLVATNENVANNKITKRLNNLAGGIAKARSLPVTAGRRLLRARGSWSELLEQPELGDAFLDLTVLTDGPDTGIADRARQKFSHLVKVQIDYERQVEDGPLRAGLPWDELYRDYFQRRHGTEPSAELLDAFREIYGEPSDAPT